jgi:branched-chain amino acid transport system permease protein
MHGDYLAIVTLGFGEIIRLVLNNWLSLTGGPNGMPAPLPTFFGLEFGKRAKDGGVPIHEFFGIATTPTSSSSSMRCCSWWCWRCCTSSTA